MNSIEECLHEEFEASVRVARIKDDNIGIVIRYDVMVLVHCHHCKTPLQFYGDMGYHPGAPKVSADRFELRAPCFTEESLANNEMLK